VKIVFTPEARETLRSITAFIRSIWGNGSADKFKASTIKTLNSISKQLYMFKASPIDDRVRQGFISRPTSVIYEIRDDYILVLYFWDNRQDPILTDNS